MFSSTSLLDSAAAAARVDVRALGHDEAMALAVEWEQAKSLMEAGQSALLAELESRGITDAVHGLRTGSWVAREAPTSPAAVRLRIRAGQTVAKHWPLVQEAWLAGELLWEHVRALLAASNPRVVEAIGGIQEPIIELAKRCGFEQWKTDVASLIRLLDQDGPDPKPGDGVNRLSWKTTLDGVLDVQATFQHDLGLVLRTAVDRRADALFRAYTRDHEQCPDIVVPGRAELCAMALIDLIRNGVGAEPGEGRARVEVTLIHHHEHHGSCEHQCDCTGATDPERDDGDHDGRDGNPAYDHPCDSGDRTTVAGGGAEEFGRRDGDHRGVPTNGPDGFDRREARKSWNDGDRNGTTERDTTPDGTAAGEAAADSTGMRAASGSDGTRTDATDRAGPHHNRAGSGTDADPTDPSRSRGRGRGRGRDPSTPTGLAGLTDLEGHPIRGEQAGVWSCVAERSVLTVDRNGVPLNLGRSRRLASPAQRKALAVRDGGCTFPGCEHPAMWTDAHHVTAWEHGGRTDLDQLVSLCRRHHGVAHRTGWVLTLGADGWTTWTTPTGITITGQRHHRRPDDPDGRDDTAIVVDLRDDIDPGNARVATVRDGDDPVHVRPGEACDEREPITPERNRDPGRAPPGSLDADRRSNRGPVDHTDDRDHTHGRVHDHDHDHDHGRWADAG